MANDWQHVEFGRLLSDGTMNGLTRPKAVRGSGYYMVNMGEIFAYDRIRDIEMDRVTLSDSEQHKFSLQVGDLLFARQSLVLSGAGKCSVFLGSPETVTFESHLIRARVNKAKADPLFYYYLFRSPLGKDLIISIVEQVAVAGIRGSDLKKLVVPVPPLPEQQAIASILGSLDDKIELNRRMNATLEGMARALFQAWFVDFDPVRAKQRGQQPEGMDAATAALFPDRLKDSVLGPIPRGWTVRPLKDICDSIFSGGTPNTQRQEYWGGGIPWLSSGETRSKFIIGTESTITELGVQNSSTRFASKGATVIASAGQGNTRGQASMLLLDTYINQSVIALRPNLSFTSQAHLFFDLERRYDEFRRLSDSNSSRGSLTTKILWDLTFLLPPREVISRFDLVAVPYIQKAGTLLRQAQTLAQLRDVLLPKLMSGEVQVKDVEKFVGELT